tara:strand:+ start:123 stop:290 length:168 start_codon:yes stop_codon:yes gene_type:complete
MNSSKNYRFLKKNYKELMKEVEDDIKEGNTKSIQIKIQLLNVILKRMNNLLNEMA